MKLSTGTSLASVVDSTVVVVVRAPGREVDLRSAGVPLIDAKAPRPDPSPEPDPERQDGAQLGKRYVNASDDLEVLVTKAGEGTLSDGDEVLHVKAAKPLPASD